MYIQKYLESARNFSNERFLNAQGWDYNGFAGGENQFFNADAAPAAPAAASMADMRTSQPYIVTVSNASNTSVSNIDILGAYQYINNSGFSNGTLTLTGSGYTIVISSGISNVTYQQFLYQTMNSPFSVGLTYIMAINVAAQITQTLTLNTQDANGNQALKTLVPVVDPYQQQTNILALNQLYDIDGYTKITISTVLPQAVVQFQFYPKANLVVARGLQGGNVAGSFGSPLNKVVPSLTR